jgi:hypothetical protein
MTLSKKAYLFYAGSAAILFFCFILNPGHAQNNDTEYSRHYLIYQKGSFKGLSRALKKKGSIECETRLFLKKNNCLVSSTTRSNTLFEDKTGNDFTSHTLETETAAGKIKCSIENKKRVIKCISLFPENKRIEKNFSKPSEFYIFDNNIFFHLEMIINRYFLNYNPLKDHTVQNKGIQGIKKSINIFIPALLKFKKLSLEGISKEKILLKLDSQIIYAHIENSRLKRLMFPFQMFEVFSCTEKTYKYAESIAKKGAPFNIVSPDLPGPEKITLYNLKTSSPDEVGSSFYKSSFSKTKSSECYDLAIKENKLRIIKGNELRQNLNPDTESREEKAISSRPAWGIIITGYTQKERLFVFASWKEFFHQETGLWIPFENDYAFAPSRYIRISNYPKNIDPVIRISEKWNKNPWFRKIDFQTVSRTTPNSFFSISIDKRDIGVAAFTLKREIDFTKRIDRTAGSSSYFYSLGSLTSSKKKQRDKYQNTFALKSTSFISDNRYSKITIKTITNEFGKMTHNFINEGSDARIDFSSDDSEKISTLKIKDYNVVLNPLDLLHWQLLIFNTYGMDKKEGEYIFTAVNPLSSTGRGLLTGLDISFKKNKETLKAQSRLYNMTFDIDPKTLLIMKFNDKNSRFTGTRCSYDEFKKTADETGKSAVFNSMKIGLQK